MTSLTKPDDNFLTYYDQIKQRIDLDLDMNAQKVIGLTRLTFAAKPDQSIEIPDNLSLFLNAENLIINDIKIIKNADRGQNVKESSKKNISNSKNNFTLFEYNY